MRIKKSKSAILHQNREILSNLADNKRAHRRNKLIEKGHVPLSEAHTKGFRKIGWDLYQQSGPGPDGGSIWTVESVDGEDWLICYTDINDQILRNLAKAVKEPQVVKTSSVAKEGTVMSQGDMVEITPNSVHSINFKYRGKRGEVTASVPDRSELTFNDGSSIWIENKDLTKVHSAQELALGDNVRMFSRRDVVGKVIKFSHDYKYVTFETGSGQEFHARINDVCKITKSGLTVQNIFTDPTNPEEKALLKEYMRGMVQQQQAQFPSQVDGTPGSIAPGDEVAPSIKAEPSAGELAAGTAIPAAGLQYAEKDLDLVGVMKTGRTLNIGDTVQKKSTGETGTIVDVEFDRKMGKFYLIDFGGPEPVIEYDTDIKKISPPHGKPLEERLPMEYSPFRQSSKQGDINPALNVIKDSALQFVGGMISQALKNHEAENPGVRVPEELESNLVKQAIVAYLSRYLPVEYRQVLSAEDKNSLSEWLYSVVTGAIIDTQEVTENAPTTSDLFREDEEETGPDMWDLKGKYELRYARTSTRAQDLVSSHISSHVHIDRILPSHFTLLEDRQKFTQDATYKIRSFGVEESVARFIASHILGMDKIDTPYLRHTLTSQFGYDKKVVPQLVAVAEDALSQAVFTSSKGRKFAIGLPGMETLRGGGGGYPGGMEIDPMGWEVKNPVDTEIDHDQLESALQENLADQSKPFEEAAPKVNIEVDPDNKRIVINYGQEEEPPIELAPEGEEVPPQVSPELPSNMPAKGPLPGEISPGAPGGFEEMNVPINF